MKELLLCGLAVLALYYGFIFINDLLAHRKQKDSQASFILAGFIGVITDFFDSLGIGSFSLTTLFLDWFKQLKSDRLLPGTLNVAHTLPTIVEAFVFVTVFKVDGVTLVSLVLAAMAGSFLGSKWISRFSEKRVQKIMGLALLITAVLMILKQTGSLAFLGSDNTLTALTGWKLIVGVVGNFILGILMTFGIGLYAPCMAMVYLLGLTPVSAFPIMMLSCAYLMPVASVNFIKSGDYDRKISFGIALFGCLGVLFAAFFVTSLNMTLLTWIIIVVVIYTGFTYLVKANAK